MQFSTILSRVKSISNVTSQDALIKDAIQVGLDKATAADLPYLMTNGVITTVAPYETGTISITNNSKAVVGTSTAWTSAMVGRKLRVDGDNAYYRIVSVTDANNLTLETVYQGTTDTAATYSIYKDEYRLPANCDVYKILRQIENSVDMVGLEPSAFDIYDPTPQTEGNPKYEILSGTKLDTYSTGTLSGTVNNSTLTGSGTSWTSVEGLGSGSNITIGSYVYTVKSVDSDTQITIYEKLLATISGSAYSISLDNYVIQFQPIPSSVQNIYFRYQRLPFLLVNDYDVPDLPERYHYILVLAGLIWAWATKDKDESIRHTGLFEAAVNQMWKRIGNISRNISFPRRSQDNISMNRRKVSLPSDYNVPIKY